MAMASMKPCRHPGCGELLRESGYCAEHKKAAQARQDAARGTAHQRGYGYRWQQVSKAFLRLHPLCECPDCCAGDKRVMVATVVDHITPHRGDMALFWNRANWQAMAKQCHDKKTAREDGGFGRQ